MEKEIFLSDTELVKFWFIKRPRSELIAAEQTVSILALRVKIQMSCAESWATAVSQGHWMVQGKEAVS